MKISGQIVDIECRTIYPGEIEVGNGVIVAINKKVNAEDQFIFPGFVDAHVHIESSMLVPAEFARMAVVHGTVATVSDPHEIGNVLGIEGVKYMVENGKQVPFKFFFGAPSCVPATTFDTAGAMIDAEGVVPLLRQPDIRYLAEMINWPGVLFDDASVKKKIGLALRYRKPVDGHAPGLRGEQARQYAAAGITTDHECFTEAEALDKLAVGMKIIIREGSAAKNFDALCGLIASHDESVMFGSDDKHAYSLEEGHINQLVRRALDKGIDLFKVLRTACVNPVRHYGMNVGQLRVQDPADFVVINNLREFRVLKTFIDGRLVAENGVSKIPRVRTSLPNNFSVHKKKKADFELRARGNRIRAIEALDGQLITNELIESPKIEGGKLVSDVSRDILKIAVVNRYQDARPAVAFIRNFNLQAGAIASSVAHDSHNIIAVGVDDQSIARAVNLIIDSRGGISAVIGEHSMLVPLPVAGLMSAEDSYEVAQQCKGIYRMSIEMGSTLASPFMTLSFMALLVIPSLKLSDKGLFNGDRFEFTDVSIP